MCATCLERLIHMCAMTHSCTTTAVPSAATAIPSVRFDNDTHQLTSGEGEGRAVMSLTYHQVRLTFLLAYLLTLVRVCSRITK